MRLLDKTNTSDYERLGKVNTDFMRELGKRKELKQPLGRAAALDEAKKWLRTLPRAEVETLVASLTDQVDLETAREAGLAPRGSADHAIAHLSDSELRELGRLLREELARSGA